MYCKLMVPQLLLPLAVTFVVGEYVERGMEFRIRGNSVIFVFMPNNGKAKLAGFVYYSQLSPCACMRSMVILMRLVASVCVCMMWTKNGVLYTTGKIFRLCVSQAFRHSVAMSNLY